MWSVYDISLWYQLFFKIPFPSTFFRLLTWPQLFFPFLLKKEAWMLFQRHKRSRNTVVYQSHWNSQCSQGDVLKKCVLELRSKYFRKVYLVKFCSGCSLAVIVVSVTYKVRLLKYTLVRTIPYKLQGVCYFFPRICYCISFFVSFAWFVNCVIW